MISVPCVIFCGGKSARMGRKKQFLEFYGTTLANFQAKRLKELFKSVYFSSKAEIENPFGIQTILDKVIPTHPDDASKELYAPIFGLQSTLEYLQSDIFTISVDTPFFDRIEIIRVAEAFLRNKRKKCIFAKDSKAHPLLGIYTFSALPFVNKNIEVKEYRLMQLIRHLDTEFVKVNRLKTQNLNTMDEYLRALERISKENYGG